MNDSQAAADFVNQSIPQLTADLNASFEQVLANPAAFCQGAGTGATRLFQSFSLPSQQGNTLLIGALCSFALVLSAAGLFIAHRARRTIRDADMESTLRDEEMVDLE